MHFIHKIKTQKINFQYYFEMDTICRTCLRNSKELELELLPLFEDAKLAHKIKTISSIEVSDDDDLPKNVCAECIININLSYNFRRVIINSDLDLRESINKKQTENENDTIAEEVVISKDYIIKWEDTSRDLDQLVNEDVQSKQELLYDDSDTINDLTVLTKEDFDNDDADDDVASNAQEESLLDSVDEIVKSKTKRTYEEELYMQEETGNETVKPKTKATSKEKFYKCDKCDFETALHSRYSNHIQNHEVKICNVCGKFITASNMSKHVALHNAPPVPCGQCGKICKNFESLRGHLIIHKGINRTCRICGEWYKERAAYIAHIKKHKANEDRSVKCPICDKRLYGKRGLQAHLRSHTGERPYPCEFCNKGFSSSNALKTHRRQHTNEKPYKCALCPMAFPQKVSLRTHLKSKHQKGIVDGS